MKKIFIVNPNAGNGNAIEIAKRLKYYCDINKIEHQFIYTNKQGDGIEIAKHFKNQNVVVYSIGGDGSINEVINGLANGNAYFNAISAGTGNDFLKTVNEYNDEIFDIDLGKVNNKFFINSFSIGIDADICYIANYLRKSKIPKSQIYNASLIYSLLKFKPYNIMINKNLEKITLLAITNGKYYGNGYNIAPDALLNDGYLNLVKAKELNRLTLIPVLIKLLQIKHYEDKNIEINKIKNILIETDINLNCEYDGELISNKKFDISIEKNAIHYYNINDFKCLKLTK